MGVEIWFLILRPRVSENGLLRGIFRPEGDKVMGGWIKLDNEELSDLCPSSSIIRMIMSKRRRLMGNVA
jgi:hypothetical protein